MLYGKICSYQTNLDSVGDGSQTFLNVNVCVYRAMKDAGWLRLPMNTADLLHRAEQNGGSARDEHVFLPVAKRLTEEGAVRPGEFRVVH